MKVSIITAAYNNRETIEHCIMSILDQTYKDIEHIIIDGSPQDSSFEKSYEYKNSAAKYVHEPGIGLYPALNKGITLATGNIIGLLHADDFYAGSTIIDKVVSHMKRHNADSCYGDLLYVDKRDSAKTVRYWKSCKYREGLFSRGWMPPHPTFFVKKKIYERCGPFNTAYTIAADYELMLRFLQKHKISTCYIPEVLVKMRTGGTSNRNIKNLVIKSSEDMKACRQHDMRNGFSTVLLKNLSKIPQFFRPYNE